MKIKSTFLVFLLFAVLTVSAQETETPIFGKGLFNLKAKDSSWSMKIGARAQFLSSFSWSDGDNSSNFLIRRARLKMNGYAASPKLQYKIELGLSNRDLATANPYNGNTANLILDAVLKYNFAKNLYFWIGQTKLPGNRERVISSANLQQVDRSILNAGFNIDRDLGIQFRHHFNLTDKFVVREIISVAKGEGRNVITENLGGYQYTGRVELLPFGNFTSKGDYYGSDLKREQSPKLSLAASYDFNNNAVKNRSNRGIYMVNDIGYYETNTHTLFIDAMFKYKGFSFMGEYADRTADDPYAKNSDGTLTGAVVQVGTGLNLVAGYLFKKNWEVSGRYSTVKFDEIVTGKEKQEQYTLGISKYIVGHNLKVQTDVSYLDLPIAEDTIMWRLQLDIHF